MGLGSCTSPENTYVHVPRSGTIAGVESRPAVGEGRPAGPMQDGRPDSPRHVNCAPPRRCGSRSRRPGPDACRGLGRSGAARRRKRVHAAPRSKPCPRRGKHAVTEDQHPQCRARRGRPVARAGGELRLRQAGRCGCAVRADEDRDAGGRPGAGPADQPGRHAGERDRAAHGSAGARSAGAAERFQHDGGADGRDAVVQCPGEFRVRSSGRTAG